MSHYLVQLCAWLLLMPRSAYTCHVHSLGANLQQLHSVSAVDCEYSGDCKLVVIGHHAALDVGTELCHCELNHVQLAGVIACDTVHLTGDACSTGWLVLTYKLCAVM